jgi:hypothetical protein
MVAAVAAAPSTALVAWSNAWLTGHIGLDEAVDAVEAAAGPAVIAELAGASGEIPLRQALGDLRGAGLTALRLALPAAGDPLGLPGPAGLNVTALEAGEAAIVELNDRRLGLVPSEDRRGSSYVGVRWTTHAAGGVTPDVPSLPEADHQLTTAMREATDLLGDLDDVASWPPEVADALTTLRDTGTREPVSGLAPGYPARARRVAALSGRLAVVVQLARHHEGGGLTADQERRRAEALRTLDRAVRRARVAAYNSVLDPVG